MAIPAIELESVAVSINGHKVLRDVTWSVEDGQNWVVLGPNGGGKSTLVDVASLGLHPTSGSVTVFGHRLGRVDIRPLRPRIGLSSAGLAGRLRDRLSAGEIVQCGRTGALEPWWHTYSEADSKRACELLSRVGLEGFADRSFVTLSSGERQRVLLARAMVNDPDIVLLDEPTAGLDMGGRESLVATLESIAENGGPSTVLVTHHVEDIPATTTHLLAIADGTSVAAGPIEETLTSELLESLFSIPVELVGDGGRWSARRLR